RAPAAVGGPALVGGLLPSEKGMLGVGLEPTCPHGPTGLSRLRLPFRHPSYHKDSIVRPSCAALCEAVVSTRQPGPAGASARARRAPAPARVAGVGGERRPRPGPGGGAGGGTGHPTAFRSAEMFAATLAW